MRMVVLLYWDDLSANFHIFRLFILRAKFAFKLGFWLVLYLRLLLWWLALYKLRCTTTIQSISTLLSYLYQLYKLALESQSSKVFLCVCVFLTKEHYSLWAIAFALTWVLLLNSDTVASIRYCDLAWFWTFCSDSLIFTYITLL